MDSDDDINSIASMSDMDFGEDDEDSSVADFGAGMSNLWSSLRPHLLISMPLQTRTLTSTTMGILDSVHKTKTTSLAKRLMRSTFPFTVRKTSRTNKTAR